MYTIHYTVVYSIQSTLQSMYKLCSMHYAVECTLYSIQYTLYSVQLYTIHQEPTTFRGRWAKKRKNYKPFLLRTINTYFLVKSFKFFDGLFFAPQNLKRAIIFLKRATFGPRAIGWRPLLYTIRYKLYLIYYVII